jgi:purine-nucleoside phosphorylase
MEIAPRGTKAFFNLEKVILGLSQTLSALFFLSSLHPRRNVLGLYEEIDEAAEFLKKETGTDIEFGLILGSGLGELAEKVESAKSFSFTDIPNFPASTVKGHKGKLVVGTLQGRKVAVMQGRIHVYEGYPLSRITLPVRVMKSMGAHSLIVTNSCGGIHTKFSPGDLMLINDHINMMGNNPLIGPNDDRLGVRFPPMSEAYNTEYRRLAHSVARNSGVTLKEGIYCALSGPAYETPAEIRFLERGGADAVGMSTVPEVMVARHSGMDVLGISCVTNVLHQGPSQDTHHEVLEAAHAAGPNLQKLILGFLKEHTS